MEFWNRFFDFNPALTSLAIEGSINVFRTTRRIRSMEREDFRHLSFLFYGDSEELEYTFHDIISVFSSGLWSWTCSGARVTLIEDITAYRKWIFYRSALESCSGYPELMYRKHRYLRDWRRVCLCISFYRAMQGSALLYSFFPLLRSILDACEMDPTPGEYVPIRQRKYFSHERRILPPQKKRKNGPSDAQSGK